MELTLKDKKEDLNWAGLFLSPLKTIKSSELSEKNHQSLKELISYVIKLNKDSIIDDNQLKDILMLVCSNYIANEVDVRISKKFDEKLLTYFSRIL